MRFTRSFRARLPIAALAGIIGAAAVMFAGPPSAVGESAADTPGAPVAAPDFEQMLKDDDLPLPDLPADFGEDSYLLATYGYTHDEAVGVLAEAGSGVAGPPPASGTGPRLFSIAPDTGYEMWRPLIEVAGNQGSLYYGAVVNFQNIHPETPAFCLDLNREGPQGKTGSTKNIDGDDLEDLANGKYSPPARYDISAAELATLLAHYGLDASANPVSVATLGLLAHANFEASSNSGSYVGAYLTAWESNQTDAELGTTAKERAAMVDAMVKWARAHTPAPDGWTAPSISLSADRRSGQIGDIRVKNERGTLVPNLPYTLTITGPANFAGGKTSLQGTTSTSALDHSFTTTGNGTVSVKVTYRYFASTMRYSKPSQPDVQRTIQSRGLIPKDKALSAEPIAVVQDFQPVVSSQVAAEFIEAGANFEDDITVSPDPDYENPHWIRIGQDYVPATIDTRVYWSAAPPTAPSKTAPDSWKLVKTISQTFHGPGTKRVSTAATRPGYYVAQSEFTVSRQAEDWRTFFVGDAGYDFGLPNETQVARFTPTLTTKASDRLIMPGRSTSDAVTISLPDNAVWPTGMKILAEGTLYGPFDAPLPRSKVAPAQAPIASTATLSFSSDEQTLTAPWTPEKAGFYTWVWKIDKDSQDDAQLFADTFTDDFMIEQETASARIPSLQHESAVREYNVSADGRAFDTIHIAGFMEGHSRFQGLNGWKADQTTATVTLYDAGFGTNWAGVGSQIPSSAKVHWSGIIPAENGKFSVGYDDTDPITDFIPGHDYVFVYHFAGDDRVAPFSSRFDDIHERFHVPGRSAAKPSVATEAQAMAAVGQPIRDTALVMGDIPEGAYLIFRAYGPQNESTPICEEKPFFTSAKIAVPGAGLYPSGDTRVTTPGKVHWIETLYTRDGTVLSEGKCGIPSETTQVLQPELQTTASEASLERTTDSASKTSAVINDKVCYREVIPGQKYEVRGTLMDAESGKAVKDSAGEKVTATASMTPASDSGCLDVRFSTDATILEGRTTVVFEELWQGDLLVASHADLHSTTQTTLVPGIRTTASNADDHSKIVPDHGTVRLNDRVCYRRLTPNKEYRFAGTLVDKSSGEPLVAYDGQPIVTEAIHRPDSAEGCIEVLFEFDGQVLADLSDDGIVVFEELWRGNTLVAVHADLEDEAQSVRIKRPTIATEASSNGGKTVTAEGSATITDRVCFTGLRPGLEYQITGMLMDKAKAKPLRISGEDITASRSHIPASPDGCMNLDFTVDGRKLRPESDLVIFESVSYRGVEVASHTDLEDRGQTVRVRAPSSELAKTGWGSPLLVAGAIGALGLGTIIAIAARRHRL